MGHKRNFYKFRIIEPTQCILSDHNALKLEIHIKQISGKYIKSWRFNNSSQNDEQVKEELEKERKNFLEQNENTIKPLGDIKKQFCEEDLQF